MSQIMEELCAEAAAEATHDSRAAVASAMLNDGMDCQVVAKYFGLPLAEVEALAGREGA